MIDTNTRSKVIDRNQAINIITEKCYNFSRNGISIYRGMLNNDDYLYIKPTDYVRISQNTNNIYTTIIDNSPYWKEYPKRSKSIVCSTNFYTSEQYGDIYIVIPFNNSNWGVCSSNDIWVSFDYIRNVLNFYNMEDFNLIIGNMISKEKLPTDQNELLDILKNINYENIIIDNYSDIEFNNLEKTIYNLLKDYNNLYDLLIDITKPDINKFELMTYDKLNIYKEYYVNNEIWTDSECILIKYDLFNKLIDSIPTLNENFKIKKFKNFIK
jgi:hypothetical protein